MQDPNTLTEQEKQKLDAYFCEETALQLENISRFTGIPYTVVAGKAIANFLMSMIRDAAIERAIRHVGGIVSGLTGGRPITLVPAEQLVNPIVGVSPPEVH